MAHKLPTLSYDSNKIRRSNSCPTGLSLPPSISCNIGRRHLTTEEDCNNVGVCITIEEVKSFVQRAMESVGTKKSHATSLANNLAMADYRGHFSHGLNRLEIYIYDMRAGITERNKEPEVLKENPSTAVVDGNNLLGPLVGTYCMELAIRKAEESGIGFVVARRSNHYGIAGFYSTMASDRGLLGMSFTNTSPIVFPTRGREAALGTNALSLAAPGRGGDSFVLDMATSSVAFGKVELAAVKGDKIPFGWGADKMGRITTDPHEVLDGGGLLPLGGGELTSGYKGYGLAMMVEIFCGILSGAEFGLRIRKWKDTGRIADLGQCFVAINPLAFEAGFEDRMQELMDLCRGSAKAEGETEILVAGDPEKKHMVKCDKLGGIMYHPNVITLMDSMADSLKIKRIVRAHQ